MWGPEMAGGGREALSKFQTGEVLGGRMEAEALSVWLSLGAARSAGKEVCVQPAGVASPGPKATPPRPCPSWENG